MSFSGLKTAVLRARDALVAEHGGLWRGDRADLCAGFQAAMRDVLTTKTERALAECDARGIDVRTLAVAGGVAANRAIRASLERTAAGTGRAFAAPPLRYCTDNATMIAYAGSFRLMAGERDGLDLSARPRWPLDADSPAMLGSGKKGAKA